MKIREMLHQCDRFEMDDEVEIVDGNLCITEPETILYESYDRVIVQVYPQAQKDLNWTFLVKFPDLEIPDSEYSISHQMQLISFPKKDADVLLREHVENMLNEKNIKYNDLQITFMVQHG